MTTTIDQADSIVGINPGATSLDEKTQERIRRGTYSEWFAKNSQPDMWPTVAEVLSSQAERIVKLHAAKRPKGDGLPENVEFCICADGFGDAASPLRTWFQFSKPMSEREREALAGHLRYCLTQPVRRLLAAFDVVEPTSEQKLSGEAFVVSTHTAACLHGNSGAVCWLVPKGAK